MKRVRYTKFNGDLASEMDIEDLLKALSDYLLDSGYRDPYERFQDMDHTLDDLREALRHLLESGEMFDDRIREQLEQAMQQGKMDELIDKLIQRMEKENYISWTQNVDPSKVSEAMGNAGNVQGEVKFEVTDKSLDFLGYKTLRDLLGSLGKSNSAGTTPATGQPASKPMEPRSATSSATPSTSIPPPRSSLRLPARVLASL